MAARGHLGYVVEIPRLYELLVPYGLVAIALGVELAGLEIGLGRRVRSGRVLPAACKDQRGRTTGHEP